ncbi:ArsC family reductase [Shewanella colwelliana]|uniref:Arsenate reductase n=1 Tax=Shewanella colwelliana TaxID=23 RepID=A0A1E5IQQ0_SHECO|nr:ArsC family reductase [Shewanella colwelliana]MDX1280947.1 ArsC family reductase [Shewanella colwelliana]OEG72378.1 arsenate reductase [Shewanella colwelliana]GIU34610.1 arsenate reductase [Shewanella colwelliana]
MTLYGIKNCDTVKKARKWLEENQQAVAFHDFRIDGLNESDVKSWVETLGWETLFNKRSTSYRNLSETEKTDIDQDKAINLMLTYPTLIKRPVLVQGDRVIVGFNAAQYQEIFS